MSYFTLHVPYSEKPTQWHPTEKTGPFSVLCRGAFPTEKRAHEWADKNIKGYDYTVKECHD
jgi:hypothetical protein